MRKVGLPVCMAPRETPELENVAVVVLRAQLIAKTFAIVIWLEGAPIEQPVENFLGSIEGDVAVVPFWVRKLTIILPTRLVLFEANFGWLGNRTPYSYEGPIEELNLKEKYEFTK